MWGSQRGDDDFGGIDSGVERAGRISGVHGGMEAAVTWSLFRFMLIWSGSRKEVYSQVGLLTNNTLTRKPTATYAQQLQRREQHPSLGWVLVIRPSPHPQLQCDLHREQCEGYVDTKQNSGGKGKLPTIVSEKIFFGLSPF